MPVYCNLCGMERIDAEALRNNNWNNTFKVSSVVREWCGWCFFRNEKYFVGIVVLKKKTIFAVSIS